MRNAFWIFTLAALVACPNTPALPDAALPLASGLPWVTLQNGSSGRDVVTAQYLLRARGQSLSVDGQFGPGTQTAVQNFQRASALSATGVVNADTWEKLILTVQNGSSGDAVRAAQDQLANSFGYGIGIDGAFGNGTKSAVQNFQRSRDLTDNGIVEITTWSALVINRAVVYLTDATARSRLSTASISVSSSGNCSDRNNASCTSLDQVRAASIRGAISLKGASGCGLIVTGGTEVGHASGAVSHSTGYKLDFSFNSCITGFIQNSMTYIGLRGDGAAQYQDARGDVYARESTHWDVIFY